MLPPFLIYGPETNLKHLPASNRKDPDSIDGLRSFDGCGPHGACPRPLVVVFSTGVCPGPTGGEDLAFVLRAV